MIRQLHVADAPAYRQIRLDALRHEPQAFCSSFQSESMKPELFMERCLKTGDVSNLLFGAFEDGQLVGIAGFVKEQAEVIQVYVDQNHRRKGLGKQLLIALIHEAFGRFDDLEAIKIGVILTSKNAAALYQTIGFESYEQKPSAVIQNGCAYDILNLKISRADWETTGSMC